MPDLSGIKLNPATIEAPTRKLDLEPGGASIDKAAERLSKPPADTRPTCSEETVRRIDLGRGIKQARSRECRPGLSIRRGQVTFTPDRERK